MRPFTIYPNKYLAVETTAYYHDIYNGGGAYRIQGNIEYDIVTLKGGYSHSSNIDNAKQRICNILCEDITRIAVGIHSDKQLTVCAIPRAKPDEYYKHILHFRDTIKEAISKMASRVDNVHDGSHYIERVVYTRTTHFKDDMVGPKPYPGITADTCKISNEVRGKDILLIDDIYTSTVNIDEDAIQALLNKGAKSVIFYSIGHTGIVYNGISQNRSVRLGDLDIDVQIISRSKPAFIREQENIDGVTILNCEDSTGERNERALYSIMVTPMEANEMGLTDIVFDSKTPLGTFEIFKTDQYREFSLRDAEKEDGRIYAKLKATKQDNNGKALEIFESITKEKFDINNEVHLEKMGKVIKVMETSNIMKRIRHLPPYQQFPYLYGVELDLNNEMHRKLIQFLLK